MLLYLIRLVQPQVGMCMTPGGLEHVTRHVRDSRIVKLVTKELLCN